MSNKLRFVCLFSLLISLLIDSAPLMTETASASQSGASEQKTWGEFIDQHKTFSVEYRYPTMKKEMLATDNSTSKLPAGTPVILRVVESLSSGNLVEASTVSFIVLNDVTINGVVAIKAGTKAQAQVSANEKASYVGQAGHIIISDFSTRTIDGAYVPLQGTVSKQASSKVVLSGVLSFFICPAFLLIKGKEAIIPAGTEKTVYTAADVDVKRI
jgi:hypothetical protein